MTTWADAWLRQYREVPDARLRLVCFPYAGGAANVFRVWHKRLPADVEVIAVQYPGRQDRLAEAPIDGMDALVEPIVGALDGLPQRPTAIFGHSMGASIAYEVVQRLATRPRLLVVSGHNAPHKAAAKPVPRTNDEVIAEIREVEGAYEALVDPDLRELVMPSLRADYRLIRTYLPISEPWQVPVPIVAYAGVSDPTARPDAIRAWADLTTSTFELVTFPGGHFFIESDAAAVLDDLVARLNGS